MRKNTSNVLKEEHVSVYSPGVCKEERNLNNHLLATFGKMFSMAEIVCARLMELNCTAGVQKPSNTRTRRHSEWCASRGCF